MILEAKSLLSSSSYGDFAVFLDQELVSISSSLDNGDDDYDDVENSRAKRCKVGTFETRIESFVSTSQREFILSTLQEELTMDDQCTHPYSFWNTCYRCGKKIDESFGVTLGYIHKGLRINNDEIARLRSKNLKTLIRQRKLYLVLDLDHTLLNSTHLSHLTANEEYLKAQASSLKDVAEGSLFMLENLDLMTKLRPFVRSFLKEAHKLFELCIYTMGNRSYALVMANLLDPKREYFSDRIISRDDGTHRHKKGLDVVLGHESGVLILDDSEHAWPEHKDNLLVVERYDFFRSSDESDSDGALPTVLEVLKRTHQMYFDEAEDDKDVRLVLKSLRKEVLKGCKIMFSHVFPDGYEAENHFLWKMAEKLGAVCLKKIDSSVTHIVSGDLVTDKSRWALRENKFLVHLSWIEAANYTWKKLPEENFSVD